MSGSIRRVGDWDRVQGLIGRLVPEIIEARNTSLKRFGLKAEKIATQHMKNQDLGWKALNAAYLSQKIREGYSENILIRTSSYFQAITSWVDQAVVYIGVKKDVLDKDGNVLADIAAVHEYGSKSGGIPARPLWQPTFKETIEWHKRENDPVKIFLKNIKARYGV